MAETALNFGPDWLRALSHGCTNAAPHTSSAPIISPPKYSLAQYRYGREEMLALMPKDPKLPDCLNDFPHLTREKFQIPLALIPVTEDEQHIWARSVNSDAVLRASGKSVPGNSMGRSNRGGSTDRGRGRGRGGYYQRGSTYEDSEDGPPGGFSRPKPVERSQSASEKDQRWDERDRRFDRTFPGRGSSIDDSISKELSRGSNENWRKFDKDDDVDWRSSNIRSSDKSGGRGSWRSNSDKDRRDTSDRNNQNRSNNTRSGSHPHQKLPGSHNSWKDDSPSNLPEWSVDEDTEPDIVGTFDSSGAFLETKIAEDKSLDERHNFNSANEGSSKDSPEADKKNPKKMPKSSTSHTSFKNIAKENAKIVSEEETVVNVHPPQPVSEPCKNVNKNSPNKFVESSTDNVIKSCAVIEQHQTVDVKKSEYASVSLPNVPENVVKNTKSDSVIVNTARALKTSLPAATVEEDAFAHHKKATENMVAQWTEEEEKQAVSQSAEIHTSSEKDSKWFYQDPQGEIQGPFKSSEMLDWFSAGYFTMGLMVRRSCDEKFCQLGELIKSWGRVPFMPGNSPPPIRAAPLTPSLSTPITQTVVPNPTTATTSAQLPKQENQLLALQQQLLLQHHILYSQLLAQLKQQDNFTSLNSQQQQQILMQQLLAQQQLSRPNINPDQQNPIESVPPPLPLPLLGIPIQPVLKNDLPMWNMTAGSAGNWPLNVNTAQSNSGGGSIWDIDNTKATLEEVEKENKRLAEEQEKLKKAEEERLAQEREKEEKRKQEELRKKQEEERIALELQKQEEEKKRLEELRRLEEEKRRLEELRRLEEERRRLEELRKLEEQKRKEEELRKQEEERKRQEELKRREELKRKEEEKRQEELRNKERRKQEELRKQEEKRKQEELQKKQLEKEREWLLELERQKEAMLLKQEENERLQREKQKEEEMKKLAEQKQRSQAPAWGIHTSQSTAQLSLADIQRLQEEKEKEEREERMRQQLQLQQQQQQQAIKQAQQNKNGLSWAKRSVGTHLEVKSLVEIQQEEAERLAHLQRNQKPAAPAPVTNSNVGVWGNPSHLSRVTAPPQSWNMSNVSTSGFWDDSSSASQTRKQTPKTNDSAFPALSNPVQPATVNSNKSKNVRAKKEEDAVTRLFGTHRKPTDEFTKWCTEAISSMPSSVDVPTFVAFLKDIESPYEVYDYVKSYFGEGKEPREFAKQFLERRSKYRNQAKQPAEEENTLWGPAPAITPSVNKTNIQNSNDCDGNSKGKAKKKKNRMQKLDSSMLGFTVQSNPDRLNVGEIDRVEGM